MFRQRPPKCYPAREIVAISRISHHFTCRAKQVSAKQTSPSTLLFQETPIQISAAEISPAMAQAPDQLSLQPPFKIPWDLKGFAEHKLLHCTLEELNELCNARRIMSEKTKELCVERLLNWKKTLKQNTTVLSNVQSDGRVEPVQLPTPGPTARTPKAPPRNIERKTFQQHTYTEWRSRLNGLARNDVHGHCVALLKKQHGNGAYSLRPLEGTAHTTDAPEVDHVFECQAMGDALFRVQALRPVLSQVDWNIKPNMFHKQPMVVQNALMHARQVHNRPEFLVVCGSLDNKKKQGAFQSSLNTLAKGLPLEHGLEDCLRINFGKGVEPFESNLSARVARAVVDRLRDIEDPLTAALRDVPQGAAQGREHQARYDELADEIVQMYEHFDIGRRV